MKQDLSIPELVTFLIKEGIVLTKVQIEQLYIFYNELLSRSMKMNLISKGDAGFLVERHFLTSFYYLYHILKSETLTHPLSRSRYCIVKAIYYCIFYPVEKPITQTWKSIEKYSIVHLIKIVTLRQQCM